MKRGRHAHHLILLCTGESYKNHDIGVYIFKRVADNVLRENKHILFFDLPENCEFFFFMFGIRVLLLLLFFLNITLTTTAPLYNATTV